MDNSLYNKFTLVFCTCDEYSFLWENFFKLLKRHWPSFNSRIISTGTLQIQSDYDVRFTKSDDKSFSSRLVCALNQCDTDIVLLMLDDFYLVKDVDTHIVNHALNLMLNNKDIKCINLFDIVPTEDVKIRDYDDYFVAKNNKYTFSITTQASFFDKKYLLKILHKGETAWDFEYMGSIRNSFYKPLILYPKEEYRNNIVKYPEGGIIHQGSFWVQDEVVRKLLMELNVNVDEIKIAGKDSKKFVFSTNSITKRIKKKIYLFLSIIFPNISYH